MNPRDLLRAAKDLVEAPNGRPRQANLLRATSTTYYALFHALAKTCADMLIGGKASDRSNHAWKQVYRALDHSTTRTQCTDRKIVQFPKEIQDFANWFVTMQTKRHEADYDPAARAVKSEVLVDIAVAEQVLADFEKCSLKDKRAFAAFVVVKTRK